jgi:hypothetical protein
MYVRYCIALIIFDFAWFYFVFCILYFVFVLYCSLLHFVIMYCVCIVYELADWICIDLYAQIGIVSTSYLVCRKDVVLVLMQCKGQGKIQVPSRNCSVVENQNPVTSSWDLIRLISFSSQFEFIQRIR